MWSRAGVLTVVVFSFAMTSHAYRMSAWVPPWDARALTSMQTNAGKLDEANPVWYVLAADGSIAKVWNAESPGMRAALSGVDLVPTIQNYVGSKFDGNLVASIVASPALREQHAEALTQLVVQNAYAGIDIDYENLSSSARADFTAFIQLLAAKLHSANKKLSIDVSAKTSDSQTWPGPGGEDFRALGAAADSIKIMGYDYHWSGSAAGPIAPLDWLDRVAAYAESTMAPEKIVIALPWYGYDWLGTTASALVYTDAIALAQSVNAQVAYDVNGEATFSYNGHIVYFQDASSYTKKTGALIAKHPRLGGFAHWRAGGEDPAIWDAVARLHNGSSSPAQPAPGSFVVAGPAALSVKAGQRWQSSFSITPIDGWNDAANVSVRQVDPFPGDVSVTPTARVGSPAILTIVPAASARAGSYRLTIVMTSGAITAQSNVTVEIEPNANRRRSARH